MVSNLLKAQVEASSYIASNKSAAEAAANAELTTLTGKGLKPAVLAVSFDQVAFSNDPIEQSLISDAQHAASLGLISPISNLQGIYDLGPLNKVLAANGQPSIRS